MEHDHYNTLKKVVRFAADICRLIDGKTPSSDSSEAQAPTVPDPADTVTYGAPIDVEYSEPSAEGVPNVGLTYGPALDAKYVEFCEADSSPETNRRRRRR